MRRAGEPVMRDLVGRTPLDVNAAIKFRDDRRVPKPHQSGGGLSKPRHVRARCAHSELLSKSQWSARAYRLTSCRPVRIWVFALRTAWLHAALTANVRANHAGHFPRVRFGAKTHGRESNAFQRCKGPLKIILHSPLRYAGRRRGARERREIVVACRAQYALAHVLVAARAR